ncbi:lytic transglycosylase domain-containing protein [Burkholderia sp. WSM2232]|uniref:lytic transglycosylase domain-containing protein n=1 Tax=Burkholderia sp. WSM2232 TaxID=944436 RepID=UPI000686F26F|nr:lytic transglycosylase domain-containing protein [Burkholderia sp. WSM2232]
MAVLWIGTVLFHVTVARAGGSASSDDPVHAASTALPGADAGTQRARQLPRWRTDAPDRSERTAADGLPGYPQRTFIDLPGLQSTPEPQPGSELQAQPPVPLSGPATSNPEDVPFGGMIDEAAREYNVPPALVRAVVTTESSFDPQAVSPKGALGLMQLMPATARRFGAADSMDPRTNLRAGTRYLRWLLDRFDSDLNLAVAAYNAGEGAVDRYGGQIPPYPETREYVTKVLARYRAYSADPTGEFSPLPAVSMFARTPTAPAAQVRNLKLDGALQRVSDLMQAVLLPRSPG